MIEFNLRSFQKYYKLKPTGLVDKETQTLLSKPRCGLPDIINDLKKKLAKLTRNIIYLIQLIKYHSFFNKI